MGKGFLNSADVARLVGVGQVTIWQWCKRGILPHWRFHRTLRFDPMEIGAFIDDSRMGLAREKGSDEDGRQGRRKSA
jgi:predicted DNA-binding transcriptional regulator AlpA